MSFTKSLKKRLNWFRFVDFDKVSGFFRYKRYQKWIYIRHPRHFLPESEISWLCESIFFKHYLPKNGDTVIDLGAGYGEEAVWLAERSPKVNYYGLEIQPVIYECLANTYNQLGKTFQCFPYAIGDSTDLKMNSQFSYASSTQKTEGYIHIPSKKWTDFLKERQINSIDLVKMNIEGAEKYFFQSLEDSKNIKRFIISCHDFRANSGDGEHYRTKAAVTEMLKNKGYSITTFNYGKGWSEDWIYAEALS